MKKYVLAALFVFAAFLVNAQNEENNDKPNYNEVKLNGLYLVLGAFDVTYERTLNEESGLGINVFIPFDDDVKDDINYYLSPYYRMYFGNKYATGFFVEGFGMLYSVKQYEFFDNGGFDVVTKDKNVTDFALGIGLGGKWTTKRGFIGEVGFGVGRTLFNGADLEDDFVAKLGISIGYRF